MSKKGSDTPSSIRIRENQRRSRNQRKELIQDLQRRVHEYELKGVAATQEMQRAARKVAQENSRLRSLLASRGVTRDEVEAYLRSFDLDSAPSHRDQALPVQTQPRAISTLQSAVQNDLSLRAQPASQSPVSTSTAPPAPSMAQPLAQPRSESQRVDQISSHVLRNQACPANQHGSMAVSSTPHECGPSAVPEDSPCCRPAESDAHHHSASTLSMLQDDAECPNTANCFCAPTPTSRERPLDSGLLISCEAAATIIAEMRGDGDRSRIRASLGCVGDKECSVKNTRVLELMDE